MNSCWQIEQEIDLNKIIKYLSLHPIQQAWIFGSYANGNATSESDLDLLIKFMPDVKIGLFGLSKISRELSDISQKKVDLVVDGSLFPWVEENVSKEKILIYERKTTR